VPGSDSSPGVLLSWEGGSWGFPGLWAWLQGALEGYLLAVSHAIRCVCIFMNSSFLPHEGEVCKREGGVRLLFMYKISSV